MSTPRRTREERGAAQPDSAAQQLVDAAITLFSQHGYDAVSTGAVAKAAGLTQSMVHYHFGSKAQLWEAAVDKLMRERSHWFEFTEGELKDVDPVTRLKILTRRFVANCFAEPHLQRILVHEGMTDSPRLESLIRRHIGARYEIFNSAFSGAMKQGLIRDLPVHDTTNVVIGAAAWTPILWHLLTRLYGDPTPESAGEFADTLVEILFHGLAVRPQADAPAEK